jgi:DNA-binding transcriptional LysR family regulator
MTLNQLRYFQAVCRYSSITAAAKVLMVSQPSISSAIKELEADCGFLLLFRKNNRIALTHEGMVFYEFISKMLDQMDALVYQLSHRDQQTGKVKIMLGVPPISGSAVLPEVLKRMYTAYPNMTIETVEAYYCPAQWRGIF